MAVQFAGSGSTGSRRRRRIVVNGENSGIDTGYLDGESGEIESQLVASAAAGPWVPDTELRIWIYSTLVAIYLGVVSFLLVSPIAIPGNLKLLADSFLSGSRPTLLIGTEVTLLFLSTQLGFLIAWYRARCKLDFSGRYRVWPWAICFFALATVCRATDLHRIVGSMIEASNALPWRGGTVGWLLPFCVAGLPLTVLLDRDVRNGRSSLWTLRVSGAMWLASAYLELFQPELQSQAWYAPSLVLLPLFASATLFVGLWHHARVVAYVCPDPPELNGRSAASVLVGALGLALASIVFWKRGEAPSEEEEEDSRPKRRRKKTEPDTEEATTKKKRKPAAKKPATRSKARTKPAEEVEEAQEEEVGEEPTEEVEESLSEETTTGYEESVEETPAEEEVAAEADEPQEEGPAEQWQDDEDVYTSSGRNRQKSKSKGRDNQIHESHGSSAPSPHMTKSGAWEEDESTEEAQTSASQFDSAYTSDEESDEEGDGGLTADQMKGLSKRQKRELKKQLRDQERTRRR